MDKWVGLLRALQDVDLDVYHLEGTKGEVGRALAARETLVKEEEAGIRDLKDKLTSLEAARKQKEGEFKAQEETTKKWEIQLKELKNFREYQVLSREIALGKKDNALREDEILKSLEEEDKVKKELKDLEGRHAGSRDLFTKERADAQEKVTGIDAALKEKGVRQEDLRKQLDESLLKKYDRIKRQRNGLALVGAMSGSCHGCHMNLPPQVVNEVRKNTGIVSCPNCQRILFWENRQE